jgi:hypothetical protein
MVVTKGTKKQIRGFGGMSRRTATRLAWSLWVVCVVIITLALLLVFFTDESYPFEPGERLEPGFAVLTGILSLAYPTVGALITSRLPSNPIGMTLILITSLAALYSLILRLRHTRGVERQQLKWFLFAAVPLTAFLSLLTLHLIVANFTTDFLLKTVYILPSWEVFRSIYYVAVLTLLVVPVCTYIAILRYRLYDLDVVINRTLVYGVLSACVVGIYVLAVGGLGALFQTRGNLAISLLATGLVAILFQPLRSRLQREVNRLMYGERDDPYAVISRLGRRLEATIAPESVLPTVVETIAQALKLPYAAILLKEGEDFQTAAAYGSPRGEPEVLPLVYQREEIGRLVLSPRAPGEEFSSGRPYIARGSRPPG